MAETAVHLIHGTGEMADRIRSLDWSRTPLGAVETWPETLLTTVNLILASPLPMQVIWGEEMISLYNDALRPAFSDKHPEALGKSARDIWVEVWPLVGPQLQAVLDQGKTVEFRNVLLPLLYEGSPRNTYWDYSYSPVVGADGTNLAIVNISKDVTESVLAQHQVEQILAATTDGMGLLNRKWEFDFLNARGREVSGLHEDPIGRNLWELFPGMVYEGSPYVYHYYRAMNEDIAGEFEAEYGDPLHISLRVIVRPVESGILIIFREITAEKQAQAAILQNEKLAAVGKLAASIAHEINNPLESVTNLLYLARNNEDPGEIQTYLSLAERELRRVSVISSQTLRFYKQSTRPTTVTCSDLFGSVLQVYQGRLVNSNIEVEKRKRAYLPIECFEGEIRQVLTNLIGNAIDAMHPQGGRLIVRSRNATEWKTGRKGVTLTVADTGAGMSAQTRARLFEAFYTTKGIGGTGLGLWVSQEIVERHEGSLRVRSSQAEDRHGAGKHGTGAHGTVFTLFLPFDAVIRAAKKE